MKIKYKSILFLFTISLVLISLSLSAEASLSSIYESPATSEGAAMVKPTAPAPAVAKPTPAAKTTSVTTIKTDLVKPTVNVAAASSKEATIVYRKDLTAKQLEVIKKEHLTYCNAFVDAEMGLRYFYKTQYDAKYKGAKAPTEDELKAMRFELSLLMKDLGSSAKRYASKISMAQMAMMDMEEDERSFFAKAIGQILGTPAYAIDTGSLSGIAAGLNSVANSTADIGLSTQADYARAAQSEANMAKAGEVAAAGVVLGTTTILAGAAVVGGVVLTAGVTTTAGAFLAPVVLVGALVGGAIGTFNAGLGFKDAITEKTTPNEGLQNIAIVINILNVTALANKAELIRVAVEAADGTKDAWIPAIFGETQKPNCPGTNGINKIQKAKKDASSAGGGGGSGGGSGGGGGCGGGC